MALAALVLLAVPPQGQLVADVRRAIPLDGAHTNAYVLIDANEDGHLDLLCANRGEDALRLGDGNGAFRSVPFAPGPDDSLDFAAGDYDGDGHEDVFAAVDGGDRLLLGDGTGAFRDASSGLPGLILPSTAAVTADVDLDGDLDVFVGGEGVRIVLLENDGTGVFADAAGDVPGGAFVVNDMVLVDLDAEGTADLIAGTGAFQAPEDPVLYLNDGSGSFADESARLGLFGAGRTTAIFVDEIDGVAGLDVLLARESSGVAGSAGNFLLLSDGVGGFTDGSALLPASNQAVRQLVDLDGASGPDVLLRSGAIHLNDGTGNLNGPAVASVTFGFFVPQILFDVDGDLDLDCVVVDTWAEDLFLNDGELGFARQVPGAEAGFDPPFHQGLGTRAGTGDVDGDGDLDVAMSVQVDFTGRSLNLFLNDGFGAFADVSPEQLPSVSNSGYTAELADVDVDGDLDILHGNAHGNDLFLNDGRGFFTLQGGGIPLFPLGMDFTVGDMDGDGDPDAFVAAQPFANALLSNDGTGRMSNVSSQLEVNPPQMTNDAEFFDFDLDGDLDLIVGNEESFTGAGADLLYRNNGRGLFEDASDLLPASNDNETVSLDWGDVDGDGDPDLVLGTRDVLGSPLPDALWLQEGGAYVDASAGLPSTSPSSIVRLADFDLDGNLDLAVGGVIYADGTKDRVFAGDGTGRFLGPVWESGPPSFSSTADVLTGDYDRDGDPDVLWVDVYRPRLAVGLGRHVARRHPLRTGKRTEVVLSGPPAGTWTLFVAGVRTVVPTDRGRLLFLPETLLLPPFGSSLGSAGQAVAELIVPDEPALVGQPVYLQALIGMPPAFTNLEPGTIGSY